jgi:hypothetical protein
LARAGQLTLDRRLPLTAGRPSPRRLAGRILSRLRRSSLDLALAAGAEERESAALAARAAQLVRPGSRRRLADALAGLREAAPSVGPGSAVAPDRDEVLYAEKEISIAERMLRCGEPLDPRGAALLRLLLIDPAGPLYSPATRGDFKAELRAAIDALDGASAEA